MKKMITLVIMVVFGFGFMGVINAAELELGSVAAVNTPVGGSDKEIVPADENATGYKYYYKISEISDNDFETYVKSKYSYENSDASSDEYTTAQSRVEEYETTFYNLIPTLKTTADLSTWKEITDGQINLTELKYQEGKHTGYVLAVAAVKGNETNIYVNRMILESASSSTLDNIEYNSNDMNAYNETTQNVVTTEDEKTESNPETGIEDYALYLVPLSLIAGSAILFKRNYA